LRIAGVNLGGGDDYRCRFDSPLHTLDDNASTVPASFNDVTKTVHCTTPALTGVPWLNVRLTLYALTQPNPGLPPASQTGAASPGRMHRNGQQYSSSSVNLSIHGLEWSALSAPSTLSTLSLQPVLGPTDGGTTIQVHGAAFDGGSDIRCRFTTSAPLEIVTEVSALLEATSAVASYHRYKTAVNITLPSWLDHTQPQVLTCVMPAFNRSDFRHQTNGTRVEVTLVTALATFVPPRLHLHPAPSSANRLRVSSVEARTHSTLARAEWAAYGAAPP
jgi:hypothetical protein